MVNKKKFYVNGLSIFCFCGFALAIAWIFSMGIFTVVLFANGTIEFVEIFIVLLFAILFLFLMLWGMLDLTEYYVFEEGQIIVRSLMRKKKVVQKASLKAVYLQQITTLKFFGRSIQKDSYYVLDDASSQTVCSRMRSSTRDLMKIPRAPKSTALIHEIWKDKIAISNFTERN